MLKKKLINAVISTVVCIFLLSGCSTRNVRQTADQHLVKKEPEALLTLKPPAEPIYLPSVDAKNKSIYLKIKDSSGKENFLLEKSLSAALGAKGYTISNDPTNAYYRLQVDRLCLTRTGPAEASYADLGKNVGGLAKGDKGEAIGELSGFIFDKFNEKGKEKEEKAVDLCKDTAPIKTAANTDSAKVEKNFSSFGGLIGKAVGGASDEATGKRAGGIADFVSTALDKDVTFTTDFTIHIEVKPTPDTRHHGHHGHQPRHHQPDEQEKAQPRETKLTGTVKDENLQYEEGSKALNNSLKDYILNLFD